jgi:hypothetical protein
MFIKPYFKLGPVFLATLLLTACGGGSGGGGSTGNGSGILNLNITDAPVDGATEVVVAFSGVTIKPSSGSAYDIDFVDENGDPMVKSIDLLSLQGPASDVLLKDQVLDAGHYNWLRLKVLSGETTFESYITLEEGGFKHSLYVPSGNETGLKLVRGFEITDGGVATFTIDFDLRKSVLGPNNNSTAYKLKPTLRIVENNSIGHIAGIVGDVSRGDDNCIGTDYAVYAFSGAGVIADDIDPTEPNPIATALVSSDTYEYAIGFLDAGAYTLAFTCQATDDDVEADDAISFIGSSDVTVNVGEETVHNFD